MNSSLYEKCLQGIMGSLYETRLLVIMIAVLMTLDSLQAHIIGRIGHTIHSLTKSAEDF